MAFNNFMHERNIYRNQPDFAKLASDFPEFQKYIIYDGKGQKPRVDFSNTDTLRMLTKILLKKDFDLDIEIPEGFLIPTVPQRLNYILWLEDLLYHISIKESKEDNVRGIDIGTGTCAIFAVLGARKNGWKFIATESSEEAIIWAKKNIERNNLQENITVVKVNQGGSSLDEVLSSNSDCYHFCMCNPPFFENSEEIRKKHPNSKETIADVAQKEEIFVKGGELDFVRNILKDSLVYKNRIRLFTSMFGKKKSFLQILKDLKEIPDAKFTSTQFFQGNTIRWGVAWTFDQSIEFQKEVKKKLKPKKAKPPLEYEILVYDSKKFNLKTIVKQVEIYLRSLEIYYTTIRSSQNFSELLLKADKNTWTHQRRKRRELERQKKDHTDKMHATVVCDENVKTVINDNLDTDTTCSGNQKVNMILPDAVSSDSISSTLKSQNDSLFSTDSGLEQTKDSLFLQNNKRKLDLDSDDSAISKKSKVDDTESTKSFPSEPSMFLKDSASVLNATDETITNCSTFESSRNEDRILQNNKRKLNLDSDDSAISKKAKVDETENTKVIPSEPSILLKDSVSESLMYSIDEIKTNCSTFESSKNEGNYLSNIETKNICHKLKGESIEDNEPEGLILHCYLQFLKAKNKIHVKMNCPPSADRNTMYQVFQLMKNKVK